MTSTFREIRFQLEAAGFSEIAQLGNHAKFIKREGGDVVTTILPHYVELAPGVAASILRQTGRRDTTGDGPIPAD